MTVQSPPSSLHPASTASSPGTAFREPAADGFMLGGFTWRHAEPDPARPVVIINAATSVRCRHYSRFADYLFSHGFDVITYDYRGIGESRPASMRKLKASWSDWGSLDFEAMLQRAQREFPGQPIDVVGHSFGGCAAGLGASGQLIRRVVTVGAQFAYWRDYAPESRWRMLGKWHVVMPLLTAIYGYFPGKRLGWLEDTPAGVVRDWATPTAHYQRRPSGRHLARRDPALPFARSRRSCWPSASATTLTAPCRPSSACWTISRPANAAIGASSPGTSVSRKSGTSRFSAAITRTACGRSPWPGCNMRRCPWMRRDA